MLHIIYHVRSKKSNVFLSETKIFRTETLCGKNSVDNGKDLCLNNANKMTLKENPSVYEAAESRWLVRTGADERSGLVPELTL